MKLNNDHREILDMGVNFVTANAVTPETIQEARLAMAHYFAAVGDQCRNFGATSFANGAYLVADAAYQGNPIPDANGERVQQLTQSMQNAAEGPQPNLPKPRRDHVAPGLGFGS